MGNLKEIHFENFTWIDISQPEKEQLEELARENNLDYLQIIDSLEHGHLPKLEKLQDYIFIILRAYTAQRHDKSATVKELSNKISFFFNHTKIITIHKADFDFLNQVPKDFINIHQLLIYIISKMVQTYVAPSEWHSSQIDDVEQVIFLRNYKKVSLEDLYYQKSQTRIIKKLLQITQDVINKITVEPSYATSLQDVKDKILGLILIYDEVAEDANNIMNTYLSVTAGKNNDVMKLLTVFAAFFLPLTFLVGLYGMNFEYMPELHWKYGYLWVVILMVIISVIIFYWFKRKKIL